MKSLLPSFWDEKNDPFATFGRDLNRVFSDYSKALPALSSAFASGFPAIDVQETDEGLEITAEVPGISEKDIDVSLEGRMLTIKGEKRASKDVSEQNRFVSERSYGAFRRAMSLPFEPEHDSIAAHVDNGVLTISLPKPRQTKEKTSRIEVKRKG